MSITHAIIAVSLPAVCIAAAAGLLRLFDVKEVTSEEAQAEAESLLTQSRPEVNVRRRVRAGAPSNAAWAEMQRFSSLSAPRTKIPSV